MYNRISELSNKTLDRGDANSLIEIFRGRCDNEDDFFYKFGVDSNGCLVSFSWHDKQMLEDYILFGDLVVFDTTYRTNKYEMICATFAGMN